MNNTDVSPEVQAVKNTGGMAQGKADMKMTMKKEAKAGRMVQNKGMATSKKINKQPNMKIDCCTPEYQRMHTK